VNENEGMETRALLRQVPQDNVDAIARLPRDLAIIKMDNDNMMALAARSQRDYAAIQKDVESQLAAFPEFARKARYSKPVGRMDKCPACDADNRSYSDTCSKCKKPIPYKYATGLSIRAAEALRLSFGFTKLTRVITETDKDHVQLDITLSDFQSGNVTHFSSPVSKTFTRWDRSTGRHSDDRFYDVIVKAKASIAIRDVVLNIVPAGMKAALENAAIKAQSTLLDDATIQKLVKWFDGKGVNQAALEGTLGKPIAAWTHEDKGVLAGIWTAIEDGETTIDEAFGIGADSPVPSNEPSPAATLVEQLKASTPATAPITETPTTPSGGTGESDFAQKKAALEQIGSVCVAISAGNYGLTAPTLDKYRPVTVENTIANLTACLAELRTLLPENHMLLKPPAEKPKRGRPAGSKNKPAETQPDQTKNETPATETVPDAPPVTIDTPAPQEPVAVDYLPQIDAILGDLQRRGTPRENMLPIIATNLTSLRNRGVDSKSIVTGSGISKSSPKECDGAEICVVLVALARHMTAEEQAKLVDDLVAVQGKMMTAADPTDGF